MNRPQQKREQTKHSEKVITDVMKTGHTGAECSREMWRYTH